MYDSLVLLMYISNLDMAVVWVWAPLNIEVRVIRASRPLPNSSVLRPMRFNEMHELLHCWGVYVFLVVVSTF